uniref:Neuronal acetylcholine receptor subunit alpha-7-like n=1 Tax=Saccoglossus kowalevskii TaxID=10224 RepID=A0ABM0MPY3_SACKO|nr:PREDICTED: neuronal acetylcholine receptor subunit alpha-7-like [Saccoglossus kowalevskii]
MATSTQYLLKANDVRASPEHLRLVDDVFSNSSYNKLVRPVLEESSNITISFELYLSQINDMRWHDDYLMWNASKYNNLDKLRVPSSMVWLPDTVLYNTAKQDNENFMLDVKTTMIIDSEGSVDWSALVILKTFCPVNIFYFPFDTQKCEMKFGSWQYDASFIDYTRGPADASNYVHNGEWDTVGITVIRNPGIYSCCPGREYPDVTFTITIRRKPLFYVFNLIVPCFLISGMSMLGFILPCESGEKVSLGITVLLSLTVFLLVVAETMPATSDTIPLIGRYYIFTIVLVAASTTMTVVVLNLHHRHNQLPRWVRFIYFKVLARLLLVQLPSFIANKDDCRNCVISNSGSVKEEEVKIIKASPDRKKNTNDHSKKNMTFKDKVLLDILKYVKTISMRHEGKDKHTKVIIEWHMVAKITDRLFFIIYVLSAVLINVIIAVQAMEHI